MEVGFDFAAVLSYLLHPGSIMCDLSWGRVSEHSGIIFCCPGVLLILTECPLDLEDACHMPLPRWDTMFARVCDFLMISFPFQVFCQVLRSRVSSAAPWGSG